MIILLCVFIEHLMANFGHFLKTLNLYCILYSLETKPLLCGDWNSNFLVDNKRLQELQILLESYNMMNILRSLTRITPTTVSLIDVIVKNKDSPVLQTAVVDLGFSDHHAQLVRTDTGKRIWSTKTRVLRQFTYNSITEFRHLLSNETWNNVYSCSDINLPLEAFLATFIHYFNVAFPLKRKHLREWPNKMRLSKGLSVSRKGLQTLNNLIRMVTLMDKSLTYIENYQRIHKNVLREAKKREKDVYVTESVDKSKAT